MSGSLQISGSLSPADPYYSFIVACKAGNADLVRDILEKENQSPSSSSSSSSNGGFVPFVSRKDKDSRTALHYAAGSGSTAVCEVLLSCDATDIDALDSSRCSPLGSALKFKRYDTAKYLLEKGADISIKSSTGHTVVHALAGRGDLDTLSFLAGARSKDTFSVLDDEGRIPLFSAVKYEQYGALQFFLLGDREGSDPTETDRYGRTAVHFAAASGKLSSLKLILEIGSSKGRDLSSVVDSSEQTPLYAAINFKRDAIVSYLLDERKVSVSIKDNRGDTPLHAAARVGSLSICKLLVDKGADACAENSDGKYPLEVASHPDTVEYLGSITPRRPRKSISDVEADDDDDDDFDGQLSDADAATRKHDIERLRGYIVQQMKGSQIPSDEETLLMDEAERDDPPSKRVKTDIHNCATIVDITLNSPSSSSSTNSASNNSNNNNNNNPSPSPSTVTLGPLAQTCLIDLSQIVFDDAAQSLGTGSFGEVLKGRFSGMLVAVKKLHPHLYSVPSAVSQFEQEIELMCRCRHQNIVSYFGCTAPPQQVSIVMEYLPSNLQTFIAINNGCLPHSTVIRIAKGIASGLFYLHRVAKVIHRDLKPSNILLDANRIPKIADFGVSRSNDGTLNMTAIGTATYMAPEMLLGRKYNDKVDVYSFGLILWQLLSGKKPFADLKFNDKDEVSPIQCAVKVATQRIRPPIPADCPKPLQMLIEQCWHHNPKNRLTSEELVHILEPL